ncbi:MAG: metallophosphoesterase [Deltaproteobacteria bacterium]|nr:metallophosphoesterase [Deltaproteobacteria bacterium]
MTDVRARTVLRLPPRGTLLVCTDLHGHLGDFWRLRELFLAAEAAGELPVLLFTGDLIHGPTADLEDWPTNLGDPYPDQSAELLEGLLELRRAFPGRVECLLGNHEHSHVGGPHTPKFWPDETQHFETLVGADRAARYRRLFRSFPLVALSPCGVSFTHGAPHVALQNFAELERVDYRGYEHLDFATMVQVSPLGRLLWCRSCPSPVARRFLAVLSSVGPAQRVVVFGHDIVEGGYQRIGEEQLQLSSSFGVARARKYYLRLDLGARYERVEDLREGVELRRLYDD